MNLIVGALEPESGSAFASPSTAASRARRRGSSATSTAPGRWASRACTSWCASPAGPTERTFEIEFDEGGIAAYCFTFGYQRRTFARLDERLCHPRPRRKGEETREGRLPGQLLCRRWIGNGRCLATAVLGRRDECAAIDSLLDGVRRGASGALLIRGEPGLGKSTLLGYAAQVAEASASYGRAGSRAKIELPYAGLQQVCAPLMDGMVAARAAARRDGGRLRSQRGRDPGPLPRRPGRAEPAVGGRGGTAAARALVDDAQWLGAASRQALAFVARRLGADSVALLLARASRQRSSTASRSSGCQASPIRTHGSSSTQCSSAASRAVRERFLAETRGNPLALLELPWTLTPARRPAALRCTAGCRSRVVSRRASAAASPRCPSRRGS